MFYWNPLDYLSLAYHGKRMAFRIDLSVRKSEGIMFTVGKIEAGNLQFGVRINEAVLRLRIIHAFNQTV